MSQLTHQEYLLKLKDKDIKIIPLEDYIKNDVKILHRCVCGNEWNVMPTSVLRYKKCGCSKGIKKTLTNKYYLVKLKEKDIEVTPLEEYINNKTKILHKCICGNEWNILPNNVLQGVKCGCVLGPKNNTHQDYLVKLKEKGIEVYPLEEYINARTKILHRCVCGNEWNILPSSVLNRNKCGCTKRLSFRDEAFYKDKKTVLYYIKVDNLYKIGVTLFDKDIPKSLKNRYGKRYLDMELLEYKVFKDGSEAFRLEQATIKKNWRVKYKGDKILPSGNTELFTEDIRPKEFLL